MGVTWPHLTNKKCSILVNSNAAISRVPDIFRWRRQAQLFLFVQLTLSTHVRVLLSFTFVTTPVINLSFNISLSDPSYLPCPYINHTVYETFSFIKTYTIHYILGGDNQCIIPRVARSPKFSDKKVFVRKKSHS